VSSKSRFGLAPRNYRKDSGLVGVDLFESSGVSRMEVQDWAHDTSGSLSVSPPSIERDDNRQQQKHKNIHLMVLKKQREKYEINDGQFTVVFSSPPEMGGVLNNIKYGENNNLFR